MGLPSPASILNGLLGSPDPTPSEHSNLSALSLSWPTPTGETASVRFDAVSNETNEALMQITDHPVEVGANVVDNARAMPIIITIEGYVSNAPMVSNPGMDGVLAVQSVPLNLPKKDTQLSLNAGLQALGNLLDPPPSNATVLTATGAFPDRVAAMLETIEEVRLARSLVTVTSKFATVTSMLISRRAIARTKADGTGATFHLQLHEVRLVSALSVDAPKPTEARGMIAAAKGSKGTKEADPAQKAHVSILKQAHKGIAGLFK